MLFCVLQIKWPFELSDKEFSRIPREYSYVRIFDSASPTPTLLEHFLIVIFVIWCCLKRFENKNEPVGCPLCSLAEFAF